MLKELLGFKKWVKSINPKERFDPKRIPAPPDYTQLGYWAAHPDKESKALFKPKGVGADDIPLDADVFYIHPTSYFSPDNWNYDFKHTQATELIEEVLMPLQASVFNGCCRIFAPKYRQATFYTFIWNTDSGRAAMELAYEDVRQAFKVFLEQIGNRPFFIATHSQGTCHGMRLLEEEVDTSDVANRLVAAYVIGFRLPEEKFTKGHLKRLHISESPTDTQCVIAYDTYLAQGGKPANLIDRAEIYYPLGRKWRKRAYKKPIGVNPLTWKRTNEVVDAEYCLGSILLQQAKPHGVIPKNFGTDRLMNLDTIGIQEPIKGEVSVQLRKDGYLYASKPKNPMFMRMMLPGGNLHNYDYTLFYMNIRENAKQRLAHYLKE